MTATTITALTAGAGTATAAVTTTCKPVANIFTMQADGDLWLYQHADPVNGAGSWAGAKHIGNGWGGKTFAGADGRIYNITTWGDLRRLRYNGNGWDTFPGGAQYETIGSGWQRYLTERGKITVDATGRIYTLEGDQLRWWFFNEETRAWAPGSGGILDVGWGRFDAVTASGKGGLQARDSSGALHRFRHQGFDQLFQAYDVIPATRWRGYDKFFSAGGDVYYAVRPDTGQLLWNRFAEEDVSNWRTSTGSVIGTDWGTDVDITATTTDCTVTGLEESPYAPRDERVHATAILTPEGGGTHLVNSVADNKITDTHSTGSGWATDTIAGKYVGISRPVTVDGAGTAVVAATNVSFGEVELHTLQGGQWQRTGLRGGMDWAPTVAHRSNNTLAVYAASDFHNQTRGHVYVREQLPNGEFASWRPFGDRSSIYVGKPVVFTRGDVTTIVMDIYGTGQQDWFRHTPGSTPVRMGTFPKSDRGVTFTGDGKGGILAFGLKDVNGVLRPAVLREKADRSGFEDSWQIIESDIGNGGAYNHLDALLLPNGTIAMSLLSQNSRVFVTTSVSPGSTQFHPWQQISPDNGGFIWPTTLALTRTGELALASRTDYSAHWLWTAPLPAEPSPTLQFTGGRIN